MKSPGYGPGNTFLVCNTENHYFFAMQQRHLSHPPIHWRPATIYMNILHLIFRPSLPAAQSQNPRRSPVTPAVLFNRYSQIRPKSERNFVQLIIAGLLIVA
jgi:hypothetical protein